MHLLFILLILVCICIPVSSKTWYNYEWMVKEGTPITKLQSTVIVPEPPFGPDYQTAQQSFWLGLQPGPSLKSGQAQLVFQSVVTNMRSGQWGFEIMQCCNPIHGFNSVIQVYPGDALTSVYTLDTKSNTWSVGWSVARGSAGVKAGATLDNGGLKGISFPGYDNFSAALMAIELDPKAEWKFGLLEWKNISIEAETTDGTWCANPTISNNPTWKNKMYSISLSYDVLGGPFRTVCNIEKIDFSSPTPIIIT